MNKNRVYPLHGNHAGVFFYIIYYSLVFCCSFHAQLSCLALFSAFERVGFMSVHVSEKHSARSKLERRREKETRKHTNPRGSIIAALVHIATYGSLRRSNTVAGVGANDSYYNYYTNTSHPPPLHLLVVAVVNPPTRHASREWLVGDLSVRCALCGRHAELRQ